jgi:hypothetical protein
VNSVECREQPFRPEGETVWPDGISPALLLVQENRMRHAIYFTPPAGHPLTLQASCWLGRDAFTGVQTSMPRPGPISQSLQLHYTRAPRRYGFHATIVSPFALVANITGEGLEAALATFCDEREPFELPDMQIREMGAFFALVPANQPDELDALASDAVSFFHYLRQPPGPEELARRQSAGLSEHQNELLQRWGYPYVKDEFRFHMTLTGDVPAEDRPAMRMALEEHFGDFLGKPLLFDRLAIFEEKPAGGPFRVKSVASFSAARKQRIA